MENYDKNKNEIIQKIIDLKTTITKKPRKKREKKIIPIFVIREGPVVVKFD
jgi:hypothetical protein